MNNYDRINDAIDRTLLAMREAMKLCPCEQDGRALSEFCRWCGAQAWTGCRWHDPECKQERGK